MVALAVQIKNISEPASIECHPFNGVILLKLLCFDCKAVRRQWPKEDAVQIVSKILINNLFDTTKALLSRGHQRAYSIIWRGAGSQRAGSVLISNENRPIRPCQTELFIF